MKATCIWGILLYLRFLSHIALRFHKPIVIGIAGSVGKSSTRNAIYAVLKEYFPTKILYGNSETGIPLGILGIHAENFTKVGWLLMLLKTPFGLRYLRNTTYLVVEMGIDDPYPPRNMGYLLTIIKPTIALNLNISATHTMQFEKLLEGKDIPKEKQRDFLLDKIAQEDTRIIRESGCKVGIYWYDNRFLRTYLTDFQKNNPQTPLLTFGEEKTNTTWYSNYSVALHETSWEFHTRNDAQILTFPFALPKEYEQIFAPTLLVGQYIGLTLTQIKTALEKKFTLPKGRGSIFQGINNATIIDSSYNASKETIMAYLELITLLKKQEKRPVVFLFGDMRELGEEAQQEHEAVAKKILATVDYLYCVGPLTKQYVMPIIEQEKKLKEVKWFPNAIYAGTHLAANMPENALVLVKGSQNEIVLEEAIKLFLADKKDLQKLCRQDPFWMKKKKFWLAS